MKFKDFDFKKATNDMLIEAVKAANGYIYYESEIEYDINHNPKRIVVYEKYCKPDPNFASILKERGVEWSVRAHS